MPPKKSKDPNKPKRGLSAFILFSQAVRPELMLENPDIKFGDVGKQLGERWRALSDDDKKPYAAKAEVDKARYLKEMESYVPMEGDEVAKKPKKPRKKKEAPKEEEEEEEAAEEEEEEEAAEDDDEGDEE